MAEEITRIRKGNDITMKVRLFDNGEAVSWDSASGIIARLRSVEQDTFTQPLDTEVDGSDLGLLIVRWPASLQCYTGLYDLVVGMERNGAACTTDAHAFALVATSAEAGWTAPASDGLNVDAEYIPLSLAVSSGAGTGGDFLTRTEASETYQPINDETLQTEDKTVPGAINEVLSIAKQGGGSDIPDAPKDGKTYGRKDGAWTEVESGNPDAVLYTEQTLTDEQKGQAQTNIGVKSTVEVVGTEDAIIVENEIAYDNQYRRYDTGELVSSSAFFVSKAFNVERGAIITGTATGTFNVAVISYVDEQNNFQQLAIKGTYEGQPNLTYICPRDGYISISSQKGATNLKLFSRCLLSKMLSEPAGGYSRDYLVNVGIAYNKATNDYSLNGIDGIPYDEACRIASTRISGQYLLGALSQVKIRTNLFPCNLPNATYKTIDYICYQNTTIEVLKLATNNAAIKNSGFTYAFAGAKKLRQVLCARLDVLDVQNMTETFTGAIAFTGLNLYRLRISIDISDCPLWQYTYLKYIIDNAANTSAITITVHPTTYSYLTGEAEPTEEVGGTTGEWQALVTTAGEKQISFATTE